MNPQFLKKGNIYKLDDYYKIKNLQTLAVQFSYKKGITVRVQFTGEVDPINSELWFIRAHFYQARFNFWVVNRFGEKMWQIKLSQIDIARHTNGKFFSDDMDKKVDKIEDIYVD